MIKVRPYKRVSTHTGKITRYLRWIDPITGKDEKEATTAKTKREAEELAHIKERILNDADYALRQRQRKVTFFEICDDFEACKKHQKRSWKRDALSISILKRIIGNVSCVEISKGLIRRYIAQRMDEGVQNATINRELSCLKSIFYLAVDDEKSERNPMMRFLLLPENNERNREISEQEFQKLLFAALPHLKIALIIGWETGWRRKEVLTLKWADVDFEREIIAIVDCKTRKPKAAPMNSLLRKTLEKIPRKSDYVINYKGKPVLDIKNSFKAACRKAEIADFRYHDLRHCFVTRKRREGHRDTAIMAITGHQNAYMLRRYDSASEEDLREVMGAPLKKTGSNPEQVGIDLD